MLIVCELFIIGKALPRFISDVIGFYGQMFDILNDM